MSEGDHEASGVSGEPFAHRQGGEPSIDMVERQRVLGYIGQLLDLSNDVERNRSDSDFVKGGGEMLYVFDETVFESFIAPQRRRLAISSQFIPEDASLEERHVRKNWELYENQSTFITTEILLSRKFLDQSDGQIFMTSPHRLELANRIYDLTHYYDDRARSEPNAVKKELSKKTNLLNFYQSDKPLSIRHLPYDLGKDLEALEAGGKSIDPRRFAYTREAAKLLVESNLTESVDQVYRLNSGEMPDRIVTLTPAVLKTKFGATNNDIDSIRHLMKDWFDRIQDELAANNIGRNPGAIRSDAESLAVVQWAAVKLKDTKTRVAFITTDQVLFDAYRRWDCSLEPEDPDFYSPFVLRRALQYVPLINLQNGNSDVADLPDEFKAQLEDLFNVISRAVDICLLPFNLSSLTNPADVGFVQGQSRSREDLALRLNQGESLDRDQTIQYFVKSFPSTWYANIGSSITAISRAWQKIERLAIGCFYDAVHRRMGDGKHFGGEPILRHFNLPLNRVTSEELTGLIHRALDNVLSKAEEAYLPLARTVIREFHVEPSQGARAPHTVWGALSGGQEIQRIVRELRKDGGQSVKREAASKGNVDDLFMIAASLMIAADDWQNAERYAEIAERLLKKGDHAAQSLARDAAFIRALAMRFSMGRLDAHFGKVSAKRKSAAAGSLKQVESIYREARSVLDPLIDHHGKYLSRQWDWARYNRAVAERAALSLFTYSSLQAVQTSDFGYMPRLNPDLLIEDTKRDLRMCRDLFDQPDETFKRFRDTISVELHYLFNLACCEVERFVFHPRPKQFVIDSDIALQREKIFRRFAPVRQDLSPIIRLELAAFFVLCGGKVGDFKAAAAQELADIPKNELSLDKHVAQLVFAKVFSETDA